MVFTSEQMDMANVNRDRVVNLTDLELLKRRIAAVKYVVGLQRDEFGNLVPIEVATGTVHFDDMRITNNSEEATIFETDDNSEIKIYNILEGMYAVEEISIGNHFGYDVDSNFISWEVENSDGTNTVINQLISANIEVTRQKSTDTNGANEQNETENASKITVKNRRKYIKIGGYAWEDKTDNKESEKDYEWTNEIDRRLQNITVTLRKADGTILDTTITDENGQYNFGNYDEDASAIKLQIDDLPGAYIEFKYNGMSYQSIPINSSFGMVSGTNSEGLDTGTSIVGQKNSATDIGLRDVFHNHYATIGQGISSNTEGNKTYDIRYDNDTENHKSTVIYGDDVRYGYEEQTHPISNVYEQYEITAVTNTNADNILCTQFTTQDIRRSGVFEISGINLGLEEREMPDLALTKDMDNVQISLNNYTHTYQYAQRFEDPENYAGGDGFDVTVKFANKYMENAYSREVYSSDVIYNGQAGNEGKLKVYVTYRIKLRNESTNLYNTIKTLANYYDARYENVVVRDENGEIIESQVDENYNQNGIKKSKYTIESTNRAWTNKGNDNYISIK